jgi:hypothetical protein
MNSKLRNVVALIAVSLILACIPAFGQVLKGSISGTVVDPQAAIVSGAQVKATQLGQGTVYTTTSDNAGLFRFSLVPAGTYKIEITKQGFKTSVRNDVLVGAGSDSSLGTVKLSVGEASTTVEVTTEVPLIETSQSQITNNFSGTVLSTFAGVQENEGLDNLALFVPGVTSSRDNGFSNTNGGSGFSVNGLRGRNNDQQIDGQNNNDNSVGGPGLFVSDTEFVNQYVLVTNQFGPEYGRNAGSVVNIITKSGTNAWHGSIYGNENNSFLNAMGNTEKRFLINPDGSHLSKPVRTNDEFTGFTIGGPFIKNKVFFFGGFDEEIFSTVANFHSDSLTPTPAGLATLAGCFPGSTALQAWNKFGPYSISGGNPVPVQAALNPNDPNSKRSFIPIAVFNGVGTLCDNVQFGGISRFLSAPTHNFNFLNRVDWQLGGDSISARYIFNRGNSFNNDFGDAAAGYPVNVPALSQGLLLSWTHNLTAHMVNEARVSFNRLNVDFGGNTIGTVPTGSNIDQAVARLTFRFPTAFAPPGSAWPAIAASGGVDPTTLPNFGLLGIGTATNLPQSRIVNTWQLQDNWNWVLGKHQFKAGVNWTYQRSPNQFLPTVNGAFRFDSWGDIGTGNTFVDNVPNRVQVAKGPTGLDFREYDTFLYVGDDWKILPSLTLNLGLTYSLYGQPANLFNSITTARETQAPPVGFWNPALPLSVRTFPTFPTKMNSFGPSVGFAWSPQWGGWLTGNGKTTVRGGYRLAYDPPFYNIYINMATAAPQVFLQSFTGAKAHTKPAPTDLHGGSVRNSLNAFLTPGVFDPRTFAQTSMSPNFGPDRVHSYNLGIERQITKNSAIEARYVGNRATDLFQSVNANPFIANLKTDFPNLVPAGLTPCPATQQIGPGAGTDVGRVNCGTGVLRNRTNTGYSYYNGLQVEFRANNLFKQLTIRSAYTFAKTLDNVSEIFSSFGGGNTVAFSQNPLNFASAEYGFSGLDIPHQWTILFNEQLPFFKDQKGFMGRALGGWGISANYILASGQRYTPAEAFSSTAFTGKNYFDNSFLASFVGVDIARPFVGNLSAPATAVGVFAGDACNIFGQGCALPVGQLISANAANDPVHPSAVPVTAQQVRFIINSNQSQKVFGTPFGNAPRNIAQDAISNVGNFTVNKKFKISERSAFEFHATMLNVFNHFNFNSIDPFVEDAGLNLQGTGFGNPSVTGATGRRIIFGGKFTF